MVQEGKKRIVVPVSTGCFDFTPARMHLLVEKNPAASATETEGEGEKKKEKEKEPPLTLAFVDADSVSLLPMTNLLQHPFVSA